MIKLDPITLSPDYDDSDLKKAVIARLRVKPQDITAIKILKKSVDARRKPLIKTVLSAAVTLKNENGLDGKKYVAPVSDLKLYIDGIKKTSEKRPVIVGSGPAGLFAALTLIYGGLKPIIIERGSDAEKRQKDVLDFYSDGRLNIQSNVQFGEGGAGTFSDGKLNTGVSGPLIPVILGEFVKFGAPPEIEYLSKPHIGTDRLIGVLKNIRAYINQNGGEYFFNTKFDGFTTSNGHLNRVTVSGTAPGVLDTDTLILATGHSARDTYELLAKQGLPMERKPFAIGVRIEHRQDFINNAMYGSPAVKGLGAADYKLAAKTVDGRGLFSFCMCPGGYVTAAASEEGHLVTNGMSRFARDGQNANSALLSGITPQDFPGDILAGIDFQRKYERLAFLAANNNDSDTFKAPVQNADDFIKGKTSSAFKNVSPTYPLGTEFADLASCLPVYVADNLRQGLLTFEKRIPGFASEGLLTGVETRSSSPMRILRDDAHMTPVSGIYAAGEGAGYAGGITSAAADGIKTALHILNKL